MRLRTLLPVLLATLAWHGALIMRIDRAGIGDPFYYDDVARALARGEGLSSRCLWNLSRLPDDLPYPACAYWGPGVPWLVGAAYGLLGAHVKVGQLAILLLSLVLGVLSTEVARQVTTDERLVLATGLVMAFHLQLGYFSATIDTPVPFAVLANVCLLALVRARAGWTPGYFVAVAAGVMAQLTRADGILLPLLVLGFALARVASGALPARTGAWLVLACAALLAPWCARNHRAFGTPFPSSVLESAALREYSDLFRVETRPSLAAYLSQDPGKIAREKLAAVASNASTLVSGENLLLLVFLPFAAGPLLRDERARPFLVYLLVLFAAMSFVFNFQSQNGSLMHSLPALFPFLFAGSLAGLDRLLAALADRPKGSLLRWLGRTLRSPAPFLLVVYVAVGAAAALGPTSAFVRAFAELDGIERTLGAWWNAPGVGGPSVRLISNDSLDLVGLLRAPVVQEPRDSREGVVHELARRFAIDYLVMFDHPRYGYRKWDRNRYTSGDTTLEKVFERRLDCPLLGHRGVRVFRVQRPAASPRSSPWRSGSAPRDQAGQP